MKKPDYGLDAPGVILGAIAFGAALVLLSVVIDAELMVAIGALLIVAGAAMFVSSRYVKLKLRDRLLDGLELRGNERVLDVGCGRGLLVVGAAKRLSTGQAVGLDLWIQRDQLHNGRDAAVENADTEGVRSRIDIRDGDMREMPFADASFDVVVSNLAIHNVPTPAGRRRAIEEIVRVLRPGGKLALIDLAFTATYAQWLGEAGLKVHRTWPAPWFFPPLGIVTAEKPALR